MRIYPFTLLLLTAAPLFGQESLPDARDRLAETRLETLEAEAELSTLQHLDRELKRSLLHGQAMPPLDEGEFHAIGVRATVLRTIASAGFLKFADADRHEAFLKCRAVLLQEKKNAAAQYRLALAASIQEESERARVEWELQQRLDGATGWRAWGSPGMARALLLALGISFLGVLAWRFAQRLGLRRLTRRHPRCGAVLGVSMWIALFTSTGAAAVLAWLLVNPLPAFRSESPTEASARLAAEAEEAIRQDQQRRTTLQQEINQMTRDFDSRHEQGLQIWHRLLATEKGQPPADPIKIEKAAADELRFLFRLASTAQRISDETARINQQTRRDHARLEEFARRAPEERRQQSIVQVSVVAGAFGFFLMILVASRMRHWLASRRAALECPRCLQSSLAQATNGAVLTCGTPGCGLAIPPSIAPLPRIHVPIHGHAVSGKTTWLALAYEQLRASDELVRVCLLPVQTPNTDRLDVLAKLILAERRSPSATAPTPMPEPLLFRVDEGRSLAPARMLLNLVEGDETAGPHDQAMQGCIFFLDPTGPIEPQFRSLVAYHRLLREKVGIEMNTALPMPVAVCIAKVDCLVHTPLQKAALPWLAELRTTQGRVMTLALLRERSEMVRRILLEIFQGFDVAGEMQRNFGPCHQFFPLSSFGLAEEELGLPLEERSVLSPFGIVELIAWLLHMNGLDVF
jgi:hypothetical protein